MALVSIITAGGKLGRKARGEGPLRAIARSPVKALLDVGGQSLLETAMEAVDQCGMISRSVVVGNDEVEAEVNRLNVKLQHSFEYAREADNVVDNIHRGFDHLGGDSNDYLIISPDLPFIGAKALDEFITKASSACGIGFPVVSRKDFLDRFPEAPNLFEKIDGIEQTIGSCIYASGEMVYKNIPLAKDIFRFRKSPHRMALLLGFGILWGYLTKTLRREQLENRFSMIMDGKVMGIDVIDPSIAYDIDNFENYNYAIKFIDNNI